MAAELDLTKKGSASLVELDQTWRDRLLDAEALLAAGRPAQAMAHAVYALEIRLKVMVCQRLDLDDLPRAFEIHGLVTLLILAGRQKRLHEPGAARVKANWEALVKMSEQLNDLRYLPDNRWTVLQATTLLNQLRDPPDGVLPWLSIS